MRFISTNGRIVVVHQFRTPIFRRCFIYVLNFGQLRDHTHLRSLFFSLIFLLDAVMMLRKLNGQLSGVFNRLWLCHSPIRNLLVRILSLFHAYRCFLESWQRYVLLTEGNLLLDLHLLEVFHGLNLLLRHV